MIKQQIVRLEGAAHDEMLAAHREGRVVEYGGMKFRTIEYAAFLHDSGPIGFFTLVEIEDEKPVDEDDVVDSETVSTTETTKPGFLKRILG